MASELARSGLLKFSFDRHVHFPALPLPPPIQLGILSNPQILSKFPPDREGGGPSYLDFRRLPPVLLASWLGNRGHIWEH